MNIESCSMNIESCSMNIESCSMNIESCSICHENLNDNICKTTCNHSFHEKCINEWKLNNNSCPLCRKIIDDKKINNNVYVYSLGMNFNNYNPNNDTFTYTYYYNPLLSNIDSYGSNNMINNNDDDYYIPVNLMDEAYELNNIRNEFNIEQSRSLNNIRNEFNIEEENQEEIQEENEPILVWNQGRWIPEVFK